jgi:YbbR domain-containing protein
MRLRPRYPGTMVLAVLLACLVWYGKALQRRERISEKQLDASVTFVNVPPDMVMTSEVPRSLVLRVRGPLSQLRTLDSSQVGVVIDLRGATEGEHEFAVETRNVIVPDGVTVLAVSPSQVPLRLERLIRRSIPVKPRVVGDPAPGLVVVGSEVTPPTVLVFGPRLQLDALRMVGTDTVSVDGAEGPVEAVVAVRSPLPLVRILDPLTVKVTVDVEPEKVEPTGRKKR